ncbi:MAG: hypothetical protein PUC53_06125 [Bacteroidales bacterium]|nr:hypothetical protein [Bacteroidales bacterium]
MIGKIVYILGIIAAVWCVLDIFKKDHLDMLKKILLTVLVLCTSWLGILVYYFILKDRI